MELRQEVEVPLEIPEVLVTAGIPEMAVTAIPAIPATAEMAEMAVTLYYTIRYQTGKVHRVMQHAPGTAVSRIADGAEMFLPA